MKSLRPYLYTIIELLIFLLSLFLPEEYTPLIIALTAAVLLSVLDKLGKGIVLRELISLHACFVCLVMPLIGYTWYTIENPLAKLWVSYMMVPYDTYYSFALPAIAGFVTIISWPSSRSKVDDGEAFLHWYINRAKSVLKINNRVALQIIGAGLACSLMLKFLPSSLQFIASLMFFGSFAGFLYVYFDTAMPKRKLILWLFGLYIIGNSIVIGMFTIVAYMGLTIFSFLFIGKKISMLKKISIFTLAVFVLLLVQSVKRDYRTQIWRGYEGNNAGLFGSLIIDQLTSGNSFFTVEAFFKTYIRGNQGFNVSLVMKRFPNQREFDGGERLLTTVASSLVPRVLWQDKPMAGGKFNMEYYAGVKVSGWSTDVGPLGEAWGSFGLVGGIVFMCALGLFIRFAYFRFFWISRNIPLLLFWLPALFYPVTFSMETDTLLVLNTLVKGSFFLWVLFKAKPDWFGKPKQKVQFRKPIPQLR
ncbi:hypothetical protein QEG73_20390 [Chitinophagaceae bacterium 26-R-25]|nr:hypothetical protein [Chitinophagaceae bacterium 26-R-25]